MIPWDLFEVRTDVVVPGFERLQIDCKLRKRFELHRLMNVVKRKYCTEDGDVPVVVSKTHHGRSAVVSVPLDFFAELLGRVRGSQLTARAQSAIESK